MRYKVLWIEDGALTEVADFAGPLLSSMKYDLDVALNISDAIKKMNDAEFDVVIVDIRIPPGSDPEWEHLYEKSQSIKVSPRLGMQLLFGLLKPKEVEIKLKNIPQWIVPEKLGVFTVESEGEVKKELEALCVNFYLQKKTNTPNTALLEFIEEIIKHSVKNSNKGGN